MLRSILLVTLVVCTIAMASDFREEVIKDLEVTLEKRELEQLLKRLLQKVYSKGDEVSVNIISSIHTRLRNKCSDLKFDLYDYRVSNTNQSEL